MDNKTEAVGQEVRPLGLRGTPPYKREGFLQRHSCGHEEERWVFEGLAPTGGIKYQLNSPCNACTPCCLCGKQGRVGDWWENSPSPLCQACLDRQAWARKVIVEAVQPKLGFASTVEGWEGPVVHEQLSSLSHQATYQGVVYTFRATPGSGMLGSPYWGCYSPNMQQVY